MTTYTTLGAAMQRADALKAKATTGDLTEDEIAEVKTVVAEIDRLKKSAPKSVGISAETLARIAGDNGATGRKGARFKTSPWASTVGDQLENVARAAGGQKAFVAGEYTVPAMLNGIETMPDQPSTLLELIPPRILDTASSNSTNVFSYVRQTVRTNNAAIVPDGGLKPTSVYSFEPVEDKFRVIAHLSEEIPTRYFNDSSWLHQWLEHEMRYGVSLAIEQQVLNGVGVLAAGDPGGPADEMTGIFNTSGIEVQAFDTDILRTTRKAVTKLASKGITATAFALSPADAETLDLAQDSTSGFYGSGPFSAGPETLWGIPRVTSPALLPGTAILADWSACELLTRESATLAVDAGGTLFEHNQARMRLEGRFGFAVYQPGAFVKIATVTP